MSLPHKRLILGVPISAVNTAQALDRIDTNPADRAQVIVFCNVHSVMSARHDPAIAKAIRSSDVAAPDGMPLVWAMRLLHRIDQKRVRGPSFMREALVAGAARGWRHFFFGTNEQTLLSLSAAVAQLAPDAIVAGSFAPPYRPMTQQEQADALDRIRSSGANLVWVGLGMPKQEMWMEDVAANLPNVTLLGVGAAFDLLAGNQPEAPHWMQRSGLEWLFRLWREPGRLWRRYIFNNPAFLGLLAAQYLRTRFTRR